MRYVMDLEQVDATQVARVGGKGARLGELARVEGVRVPPGFCVTTDAYARVAAPALVEPLDRLSQVDHDDREAVVAISAELRRLVEAIPVPDAVVAAVSGSVARWGAHESYAVRSSATAEDLAAASFAGQHDTFLNVTGRSEVLERVRSCWASLFTERAVTYRAQHGIDHRAVGMAVVVQQMVAPSASGVAFTADPVTSSRGTTAIEAVVGLGEALVAGGADADGYSVRDGRVVDRSIAAKLHAVVASPGGGTRVVPVEPARSHRPALTDAEALALARLARRIEAHFGSPQDIEWCLTDDGFVVVQTRPITTLFPVPATDDPGSRVFVSVGHGQMMTDAMRPLGISFWRLTAARPMLEAGGRMFVDVTDNLATPSGRNALLDVMGRSDPLIRDALQTVLDRDLVATRPDREPTPSARRGPPDAAATPDPRVVTELVDRTEASIATLRHDIAGRTGPELFELIRSDLAELRRLLFDPQSHHVIMAAMEATWWLNDRLDEWLGEKNAADVLTRSVPGNVTSAMGYALLDVADVIRPHPEVVAFLHRVEADDFLDELVTLPGGPEARDAICGFLDRYGMRCVGEIDITRPRWRERPTALLPTLLGDVEAFDAGAGAIRFERGRQEARAKRDELVERLLDLPDGARKADETRRMVDRVRSLIGYREFPKYGMICRYFVYKQAMLGEADRLVRRGVLRDREDIFSLRLDELHDVVRTHRVDQELIDRRRAEFASYRALRPPRVLTSGGEALDGSYRRDDLPAGALAGLAVSGGAVEGRARVVREMADAEIEPGDILVTAHTDPSWSPLFVAVAGLVTEVGGLMTHGAVITREYGLPAVVGVRDATRRIRDGQRIRVDGTNGFVEVLGEADGPSD